jgi:hypothetical protein
MSLDFAIGLPLSPGYDSVLVIIWRSWSRKKLAIIAKKIHTNSYHRLEWEQYLETKLQFSTANHATLDSNLKNHALTLYCSSVPTFWTRTWCLWNLLTIVHLVDVPQKPHFSWSLGNFLLVLSIVLWILLWGTFHNPRWIWMQRFKLVWQDAPDSLCFAQSQYVTWLFSKTPLPSKKAPWLESPWTGPFKVLEKHFSVTSWDGSHPAMRIILWFRLEIWKLTLLTYALKTRLTMTFL